MNGVTKILHNAPRKTAGTGYVILNNNQPREKYIKNCFKNQTVNIITIDGEIIPNCLVAKNVWNGVTFPMDTNARGSCVVWVNIPYLERPIVLGVLNKRDELLEFDDEYVFKFTRAFEESKITLTGDGKQGVLNILATGADLDSSQLVVKLLNKNQKALFDVYVQGDVSTNVENNVDFRVGNKITFVVRDDESPSKSATITYKLGEGFTLLDEFSNQVKTNNNGVYVEVPANKKVYTVASGSSGQPALLGDNTYSLLQTNIELLEKLITTLETATITNSGPVLQSAIFPAIPALKLNLITMKTKMRTIKSQNQNLT